MATETKLSSAALAQRVPDSDRDGPGSDLVRSSGWYRVPTVSGRAAWARYTWVEGRCVQGVCTYSPEAEEAADREAFEDLERRTIQRYRRSPTVSSADTCPRCGRETSEEQQHGVVRDARDSGDGLVHDGGCDHCCACLGRSRS